MSDLKTYVPSMAEMKHCPLCLNEWVIVEEKGKKGNVYMACTRPNCMISIWIRDPFFGKWAIFEQIDCPHCKNTKMRFFARSDSFVKWFCPNCKSNIESADPEKHGKLNLEANEKDIIA